MGCSIFIGQLSVPFCVHEFFRGGSRGGWLVPWLVTWLCRINGRCMRAFVALSRWYNCYRITYFYRFFNPPLGLNSIDLLALYLSFAMVPWSLDLLNNPLKCFFVFLNTKDICYPSNFSLQRYDFFKVIGSENKESLTRDIALKCLCLAPLKSKVCSLTFRTLPFSVDWIFFNDDFLL